MAEIRRCNFPVVETQPSNASGSLVEASAAAYAFGSVDDPAESPGLAHLVEHLIVAAIRESGDCAIIASTLHDTVVLAAAALKLPSTVREILADPLPAILSIDARDVSEQVTSINEEICLKFPSTFDQHREFGLCRVFGPDGGYDHSPFGDVTALSQVSVNCVVDFARRMQSEGRFPATVLELETAIFPEVTLTGSSLLVSSSASGGSPKLTVDRQAGEGDISRSSACGVWLATFGNTSADLRSYLIGWMSVKTWAAAVEELLGVSPVASVGRYGPLRMRGAERVEIRIPLSDGEEVARMAGLQELLLLDPSRICHGVEELMVRAKMELVSILYARIDDPLTRVASVAESLGVFGSNIYTSVFTLLDNIRSSDLQPLARVFSCPPLLIGRLGSAG